MNDLNSIRIVGNGIITSGEYNKISVVGEATVMDEVKCDYLKVVGNCILKQNAITQNVKVLGEMISENIMTTSEELEILGQLTALKDYNVNKLKVIGEGTFKENLHFEEISVLGEMIVENDCEGTNFNSKGKLNIGGLLSADSIKINPREICRINEIGGSKITIKKKYIFTLRKSMVISNIIEGDTIELDNTECKVVRGHDITILSGCKIDKIEYTGTLIVDKNSIVGEKIWIKK